MGAITVNIYAAEDTAKAGWEAAAEVVRGQAEAAREQAVSAQRNLDAGSRHTTLKYVREMRARADAFEQALSMLERYQLHVESHGLRTRPCRDTAEA